MLKTTNYDKDFVAWSGEQAMLLEQERFSELDLINLIEEVRDLGSNDKHALRSNLRIVLLHLLKWQFQPSYRSNSWLSLIVEHRQRVEELIEKSPSLKSYLEAIFSEVYLKAVRGAAKQTGLLSASGFPDACPYTLAEVLDLDFLPD